MMPLATSASGEHTLREVSMRSFEDARQYIVSRARPVTGHEIVPLSKVSGRVLAKNLISSIDVPAFACAAMDGFAVSVADLFEDRATRLSLGLPVKSGTPPSVSIPGVATAIGTGGAMPIGADAVVMKEKVTLDGEHVIFEPGVSVGQNVRACGSELANKVIAIDNGTRLTPIHASIAASLGETSLTVKRRPRVAVVTTGNELQAAGAALTPGKRYNSNGILLETLLNNLGCELVTNTHAADDLTALRDVLVDLAQVADVIITSGGVSVGTQDFVKDIITSTGELEIWRVAVKPGKPMAFGCVHGTPILALPGNPAALLLTFALLARPFLLAQQGVAVEPIDWLWAQANFSIETKARAELVAVLLDATSPRKTTLRRLGVHDSAKLLTYASAYGVAYVPAYQSVAQGQSVMFLPFTQLL